MKLYVVRDAGWEYDDSEYSRYESFTKLVRAYRTRDAAQAEAARLAAEKVAKFGETPTRSGEDVTGSLFDVVEVDAEPNELAGTAAGDYASARAAAEALRHHAVHAGRLAFDEAARNLFAAHPDLESFGWKQFTPYFNDGDACEFWARTEYPSVNGVDGEEVTDGTGYDDAGNPYQKEAASPEYPMQQAVKQMLGAYAGDDLREFFGDHVEVVVERGDTGGPKVTADDYTDHY